MINFKLLMHPLNYIIVGVAIMLFAFVVHLLDMQFNNSSALRATD